MKVLVRIASENNLKSAKVRQHFTRRLLQNIRDALGLSLDTYVPVKGAWGRLFLEIADDAPIENLTRVFGVHSVSRVQAECAPVMSEICATAERLFRERVTGRTFAVRASRSEVRGFTSLDIERQVGAALFPYARGVDLKNPEELINIEVRPEAAYLFAHRQPGPGGLPIGVQGRAVCLISGGFDSAVAAWYALKRGVALDFVFCNLGGSEYERSVVEVTRILCERWCYGAKPRLYVLPFHSIVDEIKRRSNQKYAQLLLKRFMYYAAQKIAGWSNVNAQALITGECIGQVSSQTLHSLRAIDSSIDLPILRPIIGFDKEEIIALTRRIGTHDLSEKIKEMCNISGRHPATYATSADVDYEESLLPVERLVDEALAASTCVYPRSVGETAKNDDLFTDEIPRNSAVIDCRERYHYEQWHYPGSQNIPFDDLMRNYSDLTPDRTYILYCPFGLQSAAAAEKMRASGYAAYSFAGGSASLRQRVSGSSTT